MSVASVLYIPAGSDNLSVVRHLLHNYSKQNEILCFYDFLIEQYIPSNEPYVFYRNLEEPLVDPKMRTPIHMSPAVLHSKQIKILFFEDGDVALRTFRNNSASFLKDKDGLHYGPTDTSAPV